MGNEGAIGNFNSIKVRLELMKLKLLKPISLFQFHKGAIRTRDAMKNIPLNQAFQFHKGAIRTVHLLVMLIILIISIP